ncbi:hypothetical protein ACFY12_09325 [Streptomyces sp. NPDC001339]|uniref:hypothetical protein n=1 Tax=Streptomyces sp. NPDC001339 TaxID=3364563 RepID=UPI0036864ABA
MDQPAPTDDDDHGLISPITLPRDGHAPGNVSGPDEYDSYFRIRHADTSPTAWAHHVLSVTSSVTDDLPATSLDQEERADLLDGIALLLQHTVRLTAAEPQR